MRFCTLLMMFSRARLNRQSDRMQYPCSEAYFAVSSRMTLVRRLPAFRPGFFCECGLIGVFYLVARMVEMQQCLGKSDRNFVKSRIKRPGGECRSCPQDMMLFPGNRRDIHLRELLGDFFQVGLLIFFRCADHRP